MNETNFEQLSQDYQRVEQVIRFVEANVQRQPELSEIAAHVGLSEYHLQRVFTRWVGISPKRFLQFLTKEGAKRLLEHSANLLETTYQVGLSSPGRLHDLFVTTEAVTPGEYKARGAGLAIHFGFHPTPFGECLLGVTERGICCLMFVQEGGQEATLQEFRADWPQADLHENPVRTRPFVQQIFDTTQASPDRLPLHLRGTNFQIKVWEALLRIPAGRVTTYQEVAASLGRPTASRAVGTAVGDNPIAVLIPCHRVIRKDGGLGGYRYGLPRKQALLGWEMTSAQG